MYNYAISSVFMYTIYKAMYENLMQILSSDEQAKSSEEKERENH
jgi:hypothetical protein